MVSIQSAFSAQGLLAKAIEGFSPRQAQLTMAEAVADAIAHNKQLIVEAGTGTGKTFAYLLPALMSGKKVIVSTGTKNLQEQLFHKDLPLLLTALAKPIETALLKGRANYLCQHRLEQYRESKGQLDAGQLADFVKIVRWSTMTSSGDTGELEDLAEDSTIFPYVTSTADNCLAKECPFIDTCYLVKARKKALESDLVVVNHHLFFADMSLKDIGFGELIPASDVVIFDEAHQIADIACQYFGESFSTKQIADLSNDVEQIYRTELTDMKQLSLAANKLLRRSQDFRLLFASDNSRGHWRDAYRINTIADSFSQLIVELQFLYDVLKLALARHDVIDNCFERVSRLLILTKKMTSPTTLGVSFWYETTRKHVMLHQTPLSIADKFSSFMSSRESAWIFTSATLSVNDSFEFFANDLGIAQHNSLILESPFDYAKQSMLLVPRYLPENNAQDRSLALATLAQSLIKAADGHCFLLFTSYRVMNQVAEILAATVENTLLVQGQMSKRILLSEFVQRDNAVLLATSSFWEGVDVRGDKLVCVMIDKLPFAAPDDPLLQARCENVRQQGLDPFSQIQLTQAVISLKQGVGRLIRDTRDKGVMVICDSRLVNRPYGGTFLASLPPMQRTRELDKALTFLTQVAPRKPKENS